MDGYRPGTGLSGRNDIAHCVQKHQVTVRHSGVCGKQKSLGQTKIKFEFEEQGIGDKRFDQQMEISLYRISQELVNNIIKHSGAKTVSVQLLATKSHLILVVEDNGKGFEFEDQKNRNGIGLMNIKTRAQAVNGEVNYQPSPKQGTVATVRVLYFYHDKNHNDSPAAYQ
ncbi:MAG: signal transduction histidine kinase [Flavobacteriales bacterium]